jgi:eukaryotic-like serine/threonine-protein kinase
MGTVSAGGVSLVDAVTSTDPSATPAGEDGARRPAEAGPLFARARFGRYRIERLIGQGGMAAVYAAYDTEFSVDVALKTLLPDLAARPLQVERFRREAQAARSIDHPNVVRVFDRGVIDRVPYLTMELLVGETLARRLDRGPLSLSELADVILPVCDAIGRAHRLGIIHRDLKPANIFLARPTAEGERPTPKLLDFGISRVGEGHLTRAGALLGTPHYRSPEQIIDSAAVDERSDQYSLGVIMYMCLIGRPPHTDGDHTGLFTSIVRGQFPAPTELAPGIPRGVESVILRAMRRRADERYPAVNVMKAALASALADRGSHSSRKIRPWSPVLPSAQESGRRTPPLDRVPSGPVDISEGAHVGEYRVTGIVGEGGMGVVYSGVHPLLGRKVAIKVLNHQMARSSEATARFLQEGRAASALRHPNIVDVFAFGRLPDGRHYQVMELLEGFSLRSLLEKRGSLSQDEARTVIVGLLTGLRAAHRSGVVHRDIKPDNIFVCGNRSREGGLQAGDVKILDFGLVKREWERDVAFKTRTGITLGTPAYMSPEQCKGVATIDARTDLYAAGIVLFEMLTGRVPFQSPSTFEVMSMQINAMPPPLETITGWHEPLQEVVSKALAKQREQRYVDAAAMLVAVETARPAARTPTVGGLPDGVTVLENKTPPSQRDSRDSASFPRGVFAPPPVLSTTRRRGVLRLALGGALVLGGTGIFTLASRPRNDSATGGGALGDRSAGDNAPARSVSAAAATVSDASDALAPAPRPAKLRVTVRPSARIYVDDRLVGEGQDVALDEVSPGKHSVTLETEGMASERRVVDLASGEALRLDVTLRAAPAAAKRHARGPRPKRRDIDLDSPLNPYAE